MECPPSDLMECPPADLKECPPSDLMEGGPGDLKECPPGDLVEGGPGDLMRHKSRAANASAAAVPSERGKMDCQYNRSKHKATQQRPTAKTPSARRACGAGGDEVSTDTNG